MFKYVLLNNWGGHPESDSLQFGFKPGTSADYCTWLLHAVALGSPTLCCLVDVQKGFPIVWFLDRFNKCLKKLHAVVSGVLVFMYQEKSGFVLIQGRRSATFRLSDRMREGAAASPILCAVFVDGLLLLL